MKSLFVVLALALPAQAADVADWALPDAEASFVFRAADKIPKLLKELDARFGRTRTLLGVVARLQARDVAGFHPFAGDWGPGLDPAAGVAVYVTGKPNERVRVVLGSKDEAATRAALAKLANDLFEAKIEVTAEGLRVPADSPETPAKDLKCAQRERFLICDTVEVPAAAPGRPAWLGADARLELYLQGGPVDAMGDNSPMETLSLRWLDTERGGRVEMRSKLRPEVATALAPWALGDAPLAGQDCLDARSGGMAKLSLDPPRLFQAGRAMGATPPLELLPVFAALEAHWSGELVASFAGGLLHPVVAFGLRPGADGKALLRALVAPLQTEGIKIEVTDNAVVVRAPSFNPDAPADETTFRLSYGTTPGSLVFALTPRDTERCTRGELKPMTVPAALAAKGRSGLVVFGPVGGLGALPGFMEGPPSWKVLEDVMAVAGVSIQLLGELGMAVDMAQDVALDLWWEVL